MNKLKILPFILFAILINHSCSTVKIFRDKIDESGFRIIETKPIEMQIDDANYKFHLSLYTISGSKVYSLVVSSFMRMQEDNILALKLGNNETIKLTANLVAADLIYIPWNTPQNVDYFVSIYDLEDDVFDKIEKHGIISIQIEYLDTFHEQNWRYNRLGKYITNSRSTIDEQLK